MKVIDGHVLAHPGLDGSGQRAPSGAAAVCWWYLSFWTLTKTCPSMPIMPIIRLEESHGAPCKKRMARAMRLGGANCIEQSKSEARGRLMGKRSNFEHRPADFYPTPLAAW